jgi:hypothetical protein
MELRISPASLEKMRDLGAAGVDKSPPPGTKKGAYEYLVPWAFNMEANELDGWQTGIPTYHMFLSLWQAQHFAASIRIKKYSLAGVVLHFQDV